MADSRDSGQIVDKRILETVALIEQTAQAIGTILVIIIIEVVPTHLVDDKADDKARALNLSRRLTGMGKQQGCQNNK